MMGICCDRQIRRQARGNMYDYTVLVIVLIVIAIIYMLPTLIGYARDLHRRQTIAVINLLFGWTIVVWLGVFVWALVGAPQADDLS
jgi:hypothetical protein